MPAGRLFRSPFLAPALALLVALPSLATLLYCDDVLMVARLEGLVAAPRAGAFWLYTFGDAEGAFFRANPLFWWTDPALRISFFRPLASALFALDHALFGRASVGYHAHSIAWAVVAAALAGSLYRRVLGSRAALAAVLFAVTPLHWMAVAWPSARHVLLAAAFGFAGLHAHLSARGRGRLVAPGALAFFGAGLLASEATLGALGYVVAYELLGASDARKTRVRTLMPYVVLVAAYLLLYRALGHGAHASGAYVDPIGEPGAFVRGIPARFGALACAALLAVPSELSVLFPSAITPMLAVGVAALVVFGLAFRRAARALPAEEARAARWLALGALLAVVPALGGITGDRILFVPGLGISAAIAVVARGGAGALSARAVAVVLLGLHGALGPLMSFAQAASFAKASRAATDAVAHAEIPRGPGVKVAPVAIADPSLGMYLEPAMALAGFPEPHAHPLSVSVHDHVLRRVDDTTLDVELLGGTLIDMPFEASVRAPDRAPLREGDVLETAGWKVRVVASRDGRPTRFRVTFDRPLDDPTLALVTWKGGGIRRVTVPPVGTDLVLHHESGTSGF